MADKSALLAKYIPAEAVPMTIDLLRQHRVQLIIKRKRISKFGDFRPASRTLPCRISVNHDLNKYSFLITLIHEIAHAEIWNRYENRVRPHGEQWKVCYKRLMIPFLENGIFPADLKAVLKSHLANLKSSSIYDRNLTTMLSKYDEKKSDFIYLDDLPEGSFFSIPNGRIFKKMQKIRTRCKCTDLSNNRVYLISVQAKVKPLYPD